MLPGNQFLAPTTYPVCSLVVRGSAAPSLPHNHLLLLLLFLPHPLPDMEGRQAGCLL